MKIYTIADNKTGEYWCYSDIHYIIHILNKKYRLGSIFCRNATMELSYLTRYEKLYGSENAKMILSKICKFVSTQESVNVYSCVLVHSDDNGFKMYEIDTFSQENLLSMCNTLLSESGNPATIEVSEVEVEDDD